MSNNLKELENDDLIIRKEYSRIPPKVEYFLSERGKSLMKVLDQLCIWGEKERKTTCFIFETGYFLFVQFTVDDVQFFLRLGADVGVVGDHEDRVSLTVQLFKESEHILARFAVQSTLSALSAKSKSGSPTKARAIETLCC